MAWWHRFFRNKTLRNEFMFRDVCDLYTKDGSRGARVIERSDGKFYYVEREWVKGTTWKNRGHLIGPYATPEAAESVAASCSWFVGK
jgi:hypothetical protein